MGNWPLGPNPLVIDKRRNFLPKTSQGLLISVLRERIMHIVGRRAILTLIQMRKVLLGIATVAVLAAPLATGIVCMGQNPAGDASASSLQFAVVSIHPDTPDTRMNVHFMPDGVSIDGEPVELIIQMAYGVQPDQISGLPSWAKTDHYSIRAKVDDADQAKWKAVKKWPPGKQYIPPLQGFLADRLNFKAHNEMQMHPVYCLVVAKNGPKFREATPGDTYANGIKDPKGVPRGSQSAMFGAGKWTMQGLEISQLVDYLSNQNLGYPIEDQTGLIGDYDLTLHFAPGNTPAPDSEEPSLFTALEEQLGLKLVLKKVPIKTVVVDHIDRPSPN
jgi:bla regulator protein blaR1